MSTKAETAHRHIQFANPFLVCELCGADVDAWHDPTRCACNETVVQNVPCGHQAGITSLCAAWSPVSGCRCQEALGKVDHPQRDPKFVKLR